MAYNDAKQNESGGGPMWHITRTFQGYVLGTIPADLQQTMEVTARLAALMKGAQDALTGK